MPLFYILEQNLRRVFLNINRLFPQTFYITYIFLITCYNEKMNNFKINEIMLIIIIEKKRQKKEHYKSTNVHNTQEVNKELSLFLQKIWS